MTALDYILVVAYIVLCLALIGLILVQKKRESGGLGSTMAGMGSSNSGQTYWDKNKGRSMENKLEFYTKVGIGLLFVFTFVISLL